MTRTITQTKKAPARVPFAFGGGGRFGSVLAACKISDKAKGPERKWLQAFAWWDSRSVSIANTRKRVVATKH